MSALWWTVREVGAGEHTLDVLAVTAQHAGCEAVRLWCDESDAMEAAGIELVDVQVVVDPITDEGRPDGERAAHRLTVRAARAWRTSVLGEAARG